MEVGLVIKEQYQVVEHIGRGGMADVWSARDQRLNRLVAIKTIAQSLSTEVDPIALFQQEAQTIAKMEHPHILPIYDFGDYRNNLYIVMRYVTGGSLEDKLEEQPLSLQDTLTIAQSIAQALDYAHANNVIHLDLKPPNILMDSGGSAYLADFGLATVLDKSGRAQNPGSGTLLYMAPEQLTAEIIDHRADIYSFAVMVFHMLTGTLPFDGTAPLAIKQLQYQQGLPDLADFDENIPYQITDILRQGTSVEPSQRQPTLLDIVNQMREAIQAVTIDLGATWDDDFDPHYGMETAITLDIDDAGLLEAADIYTRAKHVWAGGNGRFLLGVSHFMMMCDYYIDAEEHHLEIDDAGRQMLLRGALEYDYQVEYWWSQVDDETRRWVCLHTIRSESAPARIRAMYHLETLPDDALSPVIPKLVANALSIETNKEAKLAALQVLGTRARLLKPSQSFDIKTEFRGRLLTTTTRLGIEILPAKVWRDAIYSPEIDLLISKQALDPDQPEVAEMAARIIGRIHSLTGLRYIANEQREGTGGALRALALIRDESPYLPDVVTRQGRLYAWVANTIRRITDQPMSAVMRFFFALIGGAIGFGQQVYITYRSQALFIPQRWGNTIAVGLMMGLFVAILVMFADEIVSRLRGFWPNWLRLVFSTVFGIVFGLLIWAGYTWLYLQQSEVFWDVMRMGGFGLGFGLIASTLFHLKGWQSFIVTALSIYLPIFAAYFNNCTQLYICFADREFNLVEGVTNFSVSPVAIVGFLFGVMLGFFIPRAKPPADAPPAPPFGLTKFGGLIITLVLAIGVPALTYVAIISQASTSWDHVIFLFLVPALISTVAIVLLDDIQRVLYVALGLVVFAIITGVVQGYIAEIPTLIAPQVGADYIDPLFAYDLFWHVFSVAVPVSMVIAWGAYGVGMFRELRDWIGRPTEIKERNAWLTGILTYIMAMTAIVTLLSPFSMHQSAAWALFWTFLGLATFVNALATWQWKRWGAYGLIVCAALFVIGGFLTDARAVQASLDAGKFPELFSLRSIVFWGGWAIVAGILTLGAMRRKLWSAFGFVAMIFGWYILALFFGEFGDSIAGLVLVHVPLLVFALRFDWHQLEGAGRKRKEKPVDDDDVPTATMPAVALAPAGAIRGAPNLATEVDIVHGHSASVELKTEIDVAETYQNAGELKTELDVNPVDVDPAELKTELDLSDVREDLQSLVTEIDPNPEITSGTMHTERDVTFDPHDPQQLATELDIQSQFEELRREVDEARKEIAKEKPTLKMNTGALKDPDKPDSQSSKARLKIDTNLLKPKDEDKPDSQPSKSRLKIDTSLISKKPEGDKPDSQPSKPRLKIDTNLLKPKAEDKPDSQSSKSRLKIDTSLISKKPDEIDAVEFEETKDPTLPSRPTQKLSTTEIKAQMEAEEQAKQEADDEKDESESRKKFKLNTTTLKKDDDESDEGDED